MATGISRSKVRPAKDEWGVYDPQQAGLAALYARLDSGDSKAAKSPSPDPAKPVADTKIAATRPSLRDAK